jgi:hypothetical protein
MVASILRFFSFINFHLPAFSIAVLISSRGLPILDIPFSINLATGDFEWAHAIFALSIDHS